MPSFGRIDHEYGAWLATRPVEDDGPIYMVNFMKYRERAVYLDGSDEGRSGKEADDEYAPVDVLAAIGAVPVFFADVEPGGEWDRVGIVRYPTRRSFVEMQGRADFRDKYRHKVAGMERTVVCGALPMGVRAPAVEGARVAFEMVVDGAPLALAGAARFRVEGTIIGDGRRFAAIAVAWVGDGFLAPSASRERVVAVTRPSIDRLPGELALIAPDTPATWSVPG
jgi:hypothetical protein